MATVNHTLRGHFQRSGRRYDGDSLGIWVSPLVLSGGGGGGDISSAFVRRVRVLTAAERLLCEGPSSQRTGGRG